MFKRYVTGTGICLLFVVIGVVVGGCIEAAAPRPNHVYMEVMPYGEVNVAPLPGDIVDWFAYGESQSVGVTFQNGDSPCTETNGSDHCTITSDIDYGIFLYSCAGQASCPDPGLGPHCKGCPSVKVKKDPLHKKLVQKFQHIVFFIDQAFGFIPAEFHPSVSPAASVVPATPRQVPAQVYCKNGVTTVDPLNVVQSAGQNIYWVGKTTFTLDIPQAVCKGNTSQARTLQQCQVVSATSPVTTYQATDGACTTTPTTGATITSH